MGCVYVDLFSDWILSILGVANFPTLRRSLQGGACLDGFWNPADGDLKWYPSGDLVVCGSSSTSENRPMIQKIDTERGLLRKPSSTCTPSLRLIATKGFRTSARFIGKIGVRRISTKIPSCFSPASQSSGGPPRRFGAVSRAVAWDTPGLVWVKVVPNGGSPVCRLFSSEWGAFFSRRHVLSLSPSQTTSCTAST